MTQGHGTLELASAGTTDIGRVREHNEDFVLLRPDIDLFVLADGAGGHNAGNVASTLAAVSIAEYFESAERGAPEQPEVDEVGLPTRARRLVGSIQRANRAIRDIAMLSEKHAGMGSTVVALAFSARSALVHIGHLGDSRCYRLRGAHLEQLTEDHSFRQDVLEMRPELPVASLANLPMNAVTRALGMDPTVRVSLRTLQVATGDRYILCSDGLSNEVSRRTMRELLAADREPVAIARTLVDAANESGGRDNIGVVVVDVKAAPADVETPDVRLRARTNAIATPKAVRERFESMPEILIGGIESEEIDLRPEDKSGKGTLAERLAAIEAMMAGGAPGAERCASCSEVLVPSVQFCIACGVPRSPEAG